MKTHRRKFEHRNGTREGIFTEHVWWAGEDGAPEIRGPIGNLEDIVATCDQVLDGLPGPDDYYHIDDDGNLHIHGTVRPDIVVDELRRGVPPCWTDTDEEILQSIFGVPQPEQRAPLPPFTKSRCGETQANQTELTDVADNLLLQMIANPSHAEYQSFTHEELSIEAARRGLPPLSAVDQDRLEAMLANTEEIQRSGHSLEAVLSEAVRRDTLSLSEAMDRARRKYPIERMSAEYFAWYARKNALKALERIEAGDWLAAIDSAMTAVVDFNDMRAVNTWEQDVIRARSSAKARTTRQRQAWAIQLAEFLVSQHPDTSGRQLLLKIPNEHDALELEFGEGKVASRNDRTIIAERGDSLELIGTLSLDQFRKEYLGPVLTQKNRSSPGG